MNYDDFPIRSRIIGSASLARRNATDVPSSPSTNHDYVPIIVMTVIVLTIIGIFFLLAQYTKVLDRKKPREGQDDPENAQNAGRMEKLNQRVPNQSYRSWKSRRESASGAVKKDTTFVVCAICLETLRDDDPIRLLQCDHIFHSLCLAKWFLKKHETCPLCKASFMRSPDKPKSPVQIPERAHTR
ncbi:Transmembrane domain-containing protein [Trichoderma ghanense]|uniref:Transmembrane domain-containing protein n=1 Tax=Trichoderma ghanense TaxID=65468 RepID=A0ABY2H1M3_9HYPO